MNLKLEKQEIEFMYFENERVTIGGIKRNTQRLWMKLELGQVH